MTVQPPKISKRSMKRLIAALVLIVLLSIGLLFSSNGHSGILGILSKVPGTEVLQAGTYNVTRFDDGDTIVVDMNGREEKVRFIGVDTPETHDPRKPVQCFGKAAAEYTKQLIGDNPVRLESDILNTNRDRYNRLLRYVYLPDGTLVNARIISDGYGFAYTNFPTEKSDEFKKLEREARVNNRGLWNKCEPQKNQYGGYSSNPAN